MIPSDVERVLLQHHETPNVQGFPRGLGMKQITPLAAIFIVAEDFVDILFEKSFNKVDRDAALEELSDKYLEKGHFHTAFISLSACFHDEENN